MSHQDTVCPFFLVGGKLGRQAVASWVCEGSLATTRASQFCEQWGGLASLCSLSTTQDTELVSYLIRVEGSLQSLAAYSHG